MKLFSQNLRNWSTWFIQITLEDKLILTLLNSWFARNTQEIKNSKDLQRSIEKIRSKKRIMLFTLATTITLARVLLDQFKDTDPGIAILIIAFGLTTIGIIRMSFRQSHLFKFKKDYEEVFDILDMVPENGINSKTTRRQLNEFADDLMICYASKYITNKEAFGLNHKITKESEELVIKRSRLLRRFGLSCKDTRNYFKAAEERLERQRLKI